MKFVIFLITALTVNCSGKEVIEEWCKPATKDDEYFWICKTASENLTIAMVSSTLKDHPTELKIFDKQVSNVEPHAFDTFLLISNLILNLANKSLNFYPESFMGLSKLQTLEINTGTVVLVKSIFSELESLNSLRLAVNESIESLSRALKDLKNLERLEILDSHGVNLCPDPHTKDNYFKSIYRLQYTGGQMKELKTNSFQCLWNLAFLTITKTNLIIIEPGAFDGLDKLEELTITGNSRLIQIPANVFNSFKSLYQLDLTNNSIKRIEGEAFKLKYHDLRLLNVSFNQIDLIETGYFRGLVCRTLDLSENPLKNILEGSFNDSTIAELFMMNNYPWNICELEYWGLNSYRTIIHRKFDSPDIYLISGEQKTIDVVCHVCDADKLFKCCKRSNTSLVFVGRIVYENSVKFSSELQIFLADLRLIETKAFIDWHLEKLSIEAFGPELEIQPNSLDLPKLKTLEIYTGPVLVRKNIFQQLSSLKSLVIRVKETKVLLCEILPEVPKLKYLQIIDHYTINICHEMCYNNTLLLRTLIYNSGFIRVLSAGVFNCLKKLESLQIIRSILTTIEPGAFDGLDNLKNLKFSNNHYLTTIPAVLFSTLIRLNRLEINEFDIARIDVEDYKEFQNDHDHHYSDSLFLALNARRMIKVSYGDIYSDLWKQTNITENGIVFVSEDNSIQHLTTASLSSPIKFIHMITDSVDRLFTEKEKSMIKPLSKYPLGSSTPCYLTETLEPFRVCLNSNDTLVSVTHYDYKTISLSTTAYIHDDRISAIGKKAFVNLTIINSLVIESSAKELTVQPESFEGLAALQSLALLTGPLQLQPYIFSELKSIKQLALSYNDSKIFFCQLFPDIKELQYLVIYNHHSVDICQNICNYDSTKIEVLRYVGGSIQKLQTKAFSCLKFLIYLVITETQLSHLESRAFDGLINLKTLFLTKNYKLTHIPAGVFTNLNQLVELSLKYNRIQQIDRGALSYFSNYHQLLTLDLSFNKLKAIKTYTFSNINCQILNISHNEIKNIDKDSFIHTNVKNVILYGNRDIDHIDYAFWGFSEFITTIYFSGTSVNDLVDVKKKCKIVRPCHLCTLRCVY